MLISYVYDHDLWTLQYMEGRIATELVKYLNINKMETKLNV